MYNNEVWTEWRVFDDELTTGQASLLEDYKVAMLSGFAVDIMTLDMVRSVDLVRYIKIVRQRREKKVPVAWTAVPP